MPPPISLKVVWGPPVFDSFLEFTYIELQVYKLLPKSECRFYLGGMTLTPEGIGGGGGGGLNLTPLEFFSFKFLFLDRLPKALAQLFFVC